MPKELDDRIPWDVKLRWYTYVALQPWYKILFAHIKANTYCFFHLFFVGKFYRVCTISTQGKILMIHVDDEQDKAIRFFYWANKTPSLTMPDGSVIGWGGISKIKLKRYNAVAHNPCLCHIFWPGAEYMTIDEFNALEKEEGKQ